jgi:uncharacterized membrane protein (DUF2068 family)
VAFILNPTSKAFRFQMHSGLNTQTVPGTAEHRARLQALRTVALLELGKGVLVLAAAISLYWVDPSDIAGNFLSFLHISPDHHFAQVLLRWADTLSNAKEWIVVLVACIYSGLRFAEGYGLWNAKAWAEWIALVSGAVYLPFEIYKLAHRVTPLHAAIFLVNVAIVAFMFYLRIYLPQLKRMVTSIR